MRSEPSEAACVAVFGVERRVLARSYRSVLGQPASCCFDHPTDSLSDLPNLGKVRTRVTVRVVDSLLNTTFRELIV
jgi:hypothetical protein